MPRRFWVAWLAACVGLAATSAVAEDMLTAAEVGRVCVAALSDPTIENPKYAFCGGILMGVIATDIAKPRELACVPADLTIDGATRVFLAFLDAHPEEGTNLNAGVILRALSQHYPCPSN